MKTVGTGIALVQTAILVGVLIGIYKVYKMITDPHGPGSTTQNGHPYSLTARLFGGTSGDGSNQIYDGTGAVGDFVSTASEDAASGEGLTPLDQQLLATPGFNPGIPGQSENQR